MLFQRPAGCTKNDKQHFIN